ncbi:hypothetical protein LOK49_LG15G02281 [Camellia lanceoleosa]|uniref:Uncharacterized protein n=1 Tax=Camellia lanceoleosa TaxID=1840588 RepID=A0ACC0F542_9ERIC|nr:hypothetical protein LOK49_LG15G02281 [Camellia lanceoleosa]
MRSYTASFGASIWTETSISSSQEMYFNQNKEGGMFRLVQFQSSDEAKQLYGALILLSTSELGACFTILVEGEGGFFLAFRKQGTSLKDILEKFVDVKKFYEDNRITPFYQKILTDLLLVVRHLMDTTVKCTLDLSDIYILNGGHVMMTNFKLRGCPSSISEWKELAVVVKAINESTNYEANTEMNIFINYLESENAKNNLALISKCLSHFHELKITSLGLKNEDEVAKCFEKAFKDYIGQLYKWALIFEASSQVKLLPRKTILSKLYKEP